MKLFRKYFYLILLLSPLTFNSCEDGINIFSKEDDVQLGQQVSGEIAADPATYPPYTGNPAVPDYINQRIFNHILQSPQIEAKNIFQYQLKIIDKPDELNAFALPGGYIYVYSGLLKYLDSEAALAGVLGHEIAHAERRHSTQRMTAQYGVDVLLSLILGKNPSQAAEIAANLFVGFSFLANSRSDENEADEYSFKYLKDTRYYQGGVKFFFEKMRDEGLISSQPNAVQTFLSTHPDPIARIANTDQRLQQSGLPVYNWQSNADNIYRNEYLTNIRGKL